MRYGTGMWRRRTASGRASARPVGFEAAGEGVVSHRVGDRVTRRCDGALSAYGCMPAAEAFAVPQDMPWEQAASASLVYGTVHDMLRPLVDRVFAFDQLATAKAVMNESRHVGKLAVTMD
jgi:NADPH:quinone reductase-like Zn-dependent oxidoreductase